MHVTLGASVEAGQPLCTVCSETTGELQYALDYARDVLAIFGIEREPRP
jgi:predicted deacylase